MRASHHTLAVAMTLLLACGDSNSPDERGVSGTWTYSAEGLTSAGFDGSCVIAPMPISVTRSADSLHGITDDETFLICTPTGGVLDTTIIINSELEIRGTVGGADLAFEIHDERWSHEGTFSGDTMGGTISFRTTGLAASEVTLIGTWLGQRD